MGINKLGDFTGLAKNYSKYRVGYSPIVLDILINSLPLDITQIEFVDIGAGTGIWTRMVNKKKTKKTTAIEPNIDMLQEGIEISKNIGDSISWKQGPAEETNLPDESAHWISMASSFHWTDFDVATKEFHRILKPKGLFTAIWNPRFIESNPLLVEIENYLKELKPNIKRVSSGASGMTATIMEKLIASKYFEDVFYLEAIHTEKISIPRYIGLWKSVNDIQVQLGEEKFKKFLDFIVEVTKNIEYIEADYKTRSWSARKALI